MEVLRKSACWQSLDIATLYLWTSFSSYRHCLPAKPSSCRKTRIFLTPIASRSRPGVISLTQISGVQRLGKQLQSTTFFQKLAGGDRSRHLSKTNLMRQLDLLSVKQRHRNASLNRDIVRGIPFSSITICKTWTSHIIKNWPWLSSRNERSGGRAGALRHDR